MAQKPACIGQSQRYFRPLFASTLGHKSMFLLGFIFNLKIKYSVFIQSRGFHKKSQQKLPLCKQLRI